MAPKVQQHRYPKRKRAAVNYEIDQSIDGGLDLEDDGNISEELGEDSSASANSTSAQQTDATITFETDSEFEDATFGSRRTKKVSFNLRFASHSLLTSNSVRSLRRPRPSCNPRPSVPPSSSRSDSCKPSRLAEVVVSLRLCMVHSESRFLSRKCCICNGPVPTDCCAGTCPLSFA